MMTAPRNAWQLVFRIGFVLGLVLSATYLVLGAVDESAARSGWWVYGGVILIVQAVNHVAFQRSGRRW